MKNHLILVFLLMVFTANAQDCKVLLKTINKTYTGDCKKGKADGQGIAKGEDTYKGAFKKGLPHGEGSYTYKNGNKFVGHFIKGKKQGKGKLTKSDKSTTAGFWNKDRYIGLYKSPYKKIDKSQNISSYSVIKTKGKTNVIRFYLKEDQKQVRNPNANIVLHHGNYSNVINTRDYIELSNVVFPFKAKVFFNQDYIEFEIFNAGMWNIKTNLTNIKGLKTN